MKSPTRTLLLALLTALPTTASTHGLNIAATNPDGSCKTTTDWTHAFTGMKALPPAFTSARLFASSDCATLANAVPAALASGVLLLVGVWTQDDAHFAAEKQALLEAVAAFPDWRAWMLAVSVGSEDLYRGEAGAGQIATKIYDVRGMLREKGVDALVGHVDTWTAW
jgi:glucan endo-1,3-beta-D-glucosidase